MPTFDDHQAALNSAVFAEYGKTAKIAGYLAPIPVVMNRRAAEFEGVAYEQNTAQIYISDAVPAIGKTLTVGCDKWEIADVLERDELTQTYTLKAIK